MLGGGSVGMAYPALSASSSAIAMDTAATADGRDGRRCRRRPAGTPVTPRGRPEPPLRPPRAQRLVLGALGRPGHQPVRRPHQPARADRLRLRDHRLPRRRRDHLHRVDDPRTSCSRPSPAPSSTAGTRSRCSSSRDLLRAALVLMIPVAVLINVWLAYPLVFLITTVSIFFRPARIAILPRIVDERDLLSGQLGDVGRRDHRRRHQLPDRRPVRRVPGVVAAARVLVRRRDLPRRRRSCWRRSWCRRSSARRGRRRRSTRTSTSTRTARRVAAEDAPAKRSIVADLRVGWQFLRHEAVLMANTLQGTAGQFAVGVFTVSSIVLAKQITTAPATNTARRTRSWRRPSASATSSAGSRSA